MSMLAFQPFQRLSLADVVFHEWFTGEGKTATQGEVQAEMRKRFAQLKG